MVKGAELDPNNLPKGDVERQRLSHELHRQAREAFQRDDPHGAARLMSDSLMLAPNERALLDTFDEVALSQADPLALLPASAGPVHVATAAGRARMLMMSNRLPEALELLGQVLVVAPALGYLDWVRRWLAQPQIVAQLPWQLLLQSVVSPALRLVVRVGVPVSQDDPRLPSVGSAAEIFRALLGRFESETVLHAALTMALRRLGDPQATLAAADAGVRRFPGDWGLRTASMNALLDAGRPDDALAEARVALRLDPSDLSPLSDVAEGYLRAQAAARAMPLFQELLDARYPDADAGLHYARFCASPNAEDHRALMLLRDRRPHSDTVQRFAGELEPAVPFLNVLPRPDDATASVGREVARELAHVLSRCGEDASLTFAVRSKYPESPSVQLAFDHALRPFGAHAARMTVEVERVPTSDPRADKGPVPTPIFAWQGGAIRPLYSGAEPAAQHAVGSVAYLPFRRDVWDEAAKEVADRLGAPAAAALLAVVTNPPAPPPELEPFDWFQRCQIAAAVILSHLGPWATGPARGALYSLASGPSDWASSAAIVALAWRAGDSPAIRHEVLGAFQWLRSIIPAEGFTPWEAALAYSWRALGNHADNELADLQTWIEEYERSKGAKNDVQTQRRYGGFTIEEYAWFVLERERIVAYEYGASPSFQPPPALADLCRSYNLDPARPYVMEWEEALVASPLLSQELDAVKRGLGAPQGGG